MRELMTYLPENYLASRETVAFQQALQPEVGLMWQARDDLLLQLDPCTATWGLDYWEAAQGITTARHLDLDLRRRQVVAKLQGRETTRLEVIKNVAEALLGVPVTVTELCARNTVLVTAEAGFRPGQGTNRLRERLMDIMPAHLDWQVVLPQVVRMRLRPSLGPRQGTTAPPVFRGTLPPGKFPVTPRLGINFSAVTLRMED